MFISLYIVYGVGHGQFVNWEMVSIANFTVQSPRSGLCAVWDFGGSF